MSSVSFTLKIENSSHAASIEALHDEVFGPGRFARAAYRVREACPADERFCFVAEGEDGALLGSVRLTPISVGEGRGFLLGPLCVGKSVQSCGIGKALVHHAVEAVAASDALPVFLVGDPPYYQPLGFEPVRTNMKMPGPVDQTRLLAWWPDGFEGQDAFVGPVRCGC